LISRLRLRQVGCRPAEDFVLLCQQASPPQLSRLVSGFARLVAGIQVCLAQPFRDGVFVDDEALSDLGDRGFLVAIQSHTDDVITELFRVGLWHGVYPSRLA